MKKTAFLYFLITLNCSNILLSQELNAEQVYSKINNAVVTIYTFDASGKGVAQGSGVVLNDKGWVVTNYHVFKGANKIIVKQKSRIIEYTNIIGFDVEKDILILKIADNSFPAIQLGNSSLLRIGQKVYAIGSPMGLENSITEGIISGVRSYEQTFKNYIQISAAISHGSSGGAVVDARGRLIGITTWTMSDGQNLNFAIPINEVFGVYKKKTITVSELSAGEYFGRGYNEYKLTNYDAAIEYYKKAISINPNYFETYHNLGLIYRIKGQSQIAINYYKKAISIQPEDGETYNNLGIAYKEIGDLNNAISYYKKAIVINPNLSFAYFNLGLIYSSKGEFETAIPYYKRAVEVDPEYTKAYYQLGFAYSQKGKVEPAIMYHKKALTTDPKFKTSYNDLGYLYFNKQEYDSAINYFKTAVIIDPEYANSLFGLGITYNVMKQFDSAIINFKKVITLRNDADALYELGNAYDKIGDSEKAIEYYKKALALNPKLDMACFSLGFLYGNKGDYDSSIFYYKRAIAINPGHPLNYWNLSFTYGKKGDSKMQKYYKEKYYEVQKKR